MHIYVYNMHICVLVCVIGIFSYLYIIIVHLWMVLICPLNMKHIGDFLLPEEPSPGCGLNDFYLRCAAKTICRALVHLIDWRDQLQKTRVLHGFTVLPLKIWVLITKASLLAGVGFALAVNWGRLDAASMIFHVELVLGPPCWTWSIMSNCDPTPLELKPRGVHPAGFHLQSNLT